LFNILFYLHIFALHQKNQPMKTKFFFLVVLFLGISALTYAQTQTSAPAQTKDAPSAVVAPEKAKSGDCAGQTTTGAKMDCKWVDTNSDGKCDKCGMTEKECKEACKTVETKSASAAGCPVQKECGKASSCCSSKGGPKDK
jgi:hypothetical protein